MVIITTKKGSAAQEKKVNVSFSANLTAQFYSAQSKMKLLDTPGYATAMAQAAMNDGLDPVSYAQGYGLNLNAPSGYPISVYDAVNNRYVDYTVNGFYDGYINAKRTMLMSNTDWLDEISRTGFSQNYDVAVSTASERGSSFFSLGYRRNEGILKYTNFENIAARINTSYNICPIVTVGENFTLTYTKQVDCQPLENALKIPSIVPVFEIDGKTYGGPVGSMADRQNPLRELAFNRDNSLNVWRLFGNAYVDIKPVKGLVLRSNFGLDYDAAFIHSYNYTFHSDIVNNDTNSTTLSQANDSKWTWTNTANYNFTVANDHIFTVLLGMEMFRQSRIDFAMNDYVIRYTDVMLMRAEALIETNKLEEARTIINDIRQRAANSIDKHIAYAADYCDIALYPSSYFSNKETARKCLRWERRLEMAMESSRYFDLRRWGIASTVLNRYFEYEKNSSYDGTRYGQYYQDAHYTPGKNEFYPIPYNQLYYVPGLYVQNKGYN